jgi:hypothetical protein
MGFRALLLALVFSGASWTAIAGEARVRLWEVPADGAASPGKRDGWKPLAAAPGALSSVAIENKRLVVVIQNGAAGPVVFTTSAENPSRVELAALGVGGEAGKIAKIELAGAGANEATVRFTAGKATAEIALKADACFVTVAPKDGADRLAVRAGFRYAALPDFFANDVVCVPQRFKAERVGVPAENFLFGFLEGERAMVMCAWQGTLSLGAKEDAAKPAERSGREPRVDLLLAGEGDARRFTAGEIEFLGKPVYVGVIEGDRLWHEESVADWDAQKARKIAWKPPFEAKWRADWVCAEGKRSEDWYARALSSVFLFEGQPGAKWVNVENPPQICQQGLWPYYQYQSWFAKNGDAWLSPYADRSVRKGGKKPLANIYETVVIYPLDRTEKTPLDAFTPVDIMRETLGQGPCEYALDLEGLKGRRAHGGDKPMRFDTATCAIRDGVIGPILREKVKKGEKLPDEEKGKLVDGMKNMLQFVHVVNERLQEYKRFNEELSRLCAENAAKEKVKPVVDGIQPIVKAMNQQLSGLLDRAGKDLARWDTLMPELVKKVEADDYGAAGRATDIANGFAEYQDVGMAQSRRFTVGIRTEAAMVEASDPEARAFVEKVRDLCQKVMRKRHPMEWYIFD